MTGCFLCVVIRVFCTFGSPHSEISSRVSSVSKLGLRACGFFTPPPIRTRLFDIHIWHFRRPVVFLIFRLIHQFCLQSFRCDYLLCLLCHMLIERIYKLWHIYKTFTLKHTHTTGAIGNVNLFTCISIVWKQRKRLFGRMNNTQKTHKRALTEWIGWQNKNPSKPHRHTPYSECVLYPRRLLFYSTLALSLSLFFWSALRRRYDSCAAYILNCAS